LASKIKQSKDAKAAMAAQMPKQPPVAQQNMAYGQGVEALPSNLPVAGMAGGGIIAFDEGGEVIRAYDGLPPDSIKQPNLYEGAPGYFNVRSNPQGFTQLTYEQYMSLTPAAKQQYVNQYGAPPARTAVQNPLQQSLGIKPPSTLERAVMEGTPVRPQVQNTTPKAATQKPAAAPADVAVAAAAPAEEKKTPVSNKGIDDYFQTLNTGAGASTKGKSSAGIAEPYKITKYDDSELKDILKGEMNPKTGKAWTYDELAQRNKAEQIAAGIDFDVYKSQREELNKLKEKSAERSKLDSALPWFAAAEAFGKAKAGESGMSSIASALGAYGKSAVDIDEKEQARQEKIRTEGNALALAQNAFNQAQYSGNKSDLKEAQSAVRSARTNLFNLGVKQVDQQNEVAKTVYETQAKKDIAAMQEAGANARYGKEEQTIKSLARIIHDAHPEMPLDEVMKEAYRTKAAGSIYGADVRDVASQRTAINAQIVKLQGTPAYTTADKAAKEAELARLNKLLLTIGTGTSTNPADISGTAAANTVDFSKLPK
jgi:hypothetical protein